MGRRRTSAVNQGSERAVSAPALSDLNAKQREKLAIELRLAGHDFDEIAVRCGYAGRSGAFAAWRRALRAIPKAVADDARALECQRLDALLTVYWPKAMAGDGWSMDRVLRLSEQRAALLGLNAVRENGQPQAPLIIEVATTTTQALRGELVTEQVALVQAMEGEQHGDSDD